MRAFYITISLLWLTLCGACAERQIVEILQPISLLGTDTEAEPLNDGQSMFAALVNRPTVIGGAFPEDPVAAMCLPHRIAGAPKGFPRESNLIVLVGAKLRAEWGEQAYIVHADFSKAKVEENLGVTLLQVMQLTAKCLEKNLGGKGDERPIKIKWLLPAGMEVEERLLPKEIR